MNSSRGPVRTGTRGYAHLIEVSVPIGRLWRALTDPALVRIWSGQEAEVDPRKGGLYRIGRRRAGGREAHIDIFDVNRRLRLIYFNDPDQPTADSAVVDDFLLDSRGNGNASLRLLGSNIPDEAAWNGTYVRLRTGWERSMARIKVTLESPPKPQRARENEPPKDPPLPGLDY